MEKTIVTCKYSNCLHDDRQLNKDDAIRSGNAYYHKDCFKTKEDIKQIIALFQKHINSNPVYSQLQTVIKNIVFTKGLGSDLLLFGLKYYIENKIPLNYPQGLYYVIQNKQMIAAYNKQSRKSANHQVDILKETESKFVHKPLKSKNFSDIIS